MTSPTPVPLRAHLLRATHEWLSENGHTPYVQVLVDRYVQVPPEYVRDGSIVLNISYDSTNKLVLGDVWVEFQARFNGQVREIMFPMDHIVSLFSKETQEGYQGMTGEEFVAIREGRYQLPEEVQTQAAADGAVAEGDADEQVTPAAASADAASAEKAKPVFTRVK